MAARLAVNVVLPGPDGAPFALYEGDEVPDWAEGQIGAHCLEQDTDDGGSDADDGDADSDGGGDEQDTDDGATDGPPPKGGPGSSAEVWAAYAEAHGVTVPNDADRAAIIAACEAAGVPTE